MARDVEFNYTASDKTGPAAASVERRMKETGKKSGKGIGDDVSTGLLSGLKAAIPSGGQLISTVGVVAAPVLAATLSAAVIAGVSAAAVGAGVLIASRDARVKQAGAELSDTLMKGLDESAEPFVQPILKQVDKIEDRFQLLRPRIDRIFANSAGFLDPLVDGALDGLDGITRGIDHLVANGGPVIDALGDSFSILGDSIGHSLEIISGGSDEAGSALRSVSTVIGETIEALAWLVRGLTEVYNVIAYIPGKMMEFQRWLGLIDDEGQITAHTLGGVAENTTLLGMKAQGASGPILTLSEQINGLSEASRSAFAAETNVGEAMDAVTAAAKKNGKTLDANTEKGRANRGALQNLATALIGQYNATVAVNGEGAKSNEVARTNREAFVKLATSMTGSKKKAEDLATALGLIPVKKAVSVTLDTASASAKAKAIQSQINNIKGKTVTVRVVASGPAKGQALYGNQAPQFDARDSFRTPGSDAGASRTGGPSPVSVSSEVNVSLDGAPFYAMTSRVVDRSASRSAFRQKVGRR